jgi:hypothetical protein
LSSCLVSKLVKIKIYKTVVLLVDDGLLGSNTSIFWCEDVGSMFLQNVGIHLQVYTVYPVDPHWHLHHCENLKSLNCTCFGPKREEVTEERELQNKELYNLSSSSIVSTVYRSWT